MDTPKSPIRFLAIATVDGQSFIPGDMSRRIDQTMLECGLVVGQLPPSLADLSRKLKHTDFSFVAKKAAE
jgi:hypothetical protein